MSPVCDTHATMFSSCKLALGGVFEFYPGSPCNSLLINVPNRYQRSSASSYMSVYVTKIILCKVKMKIFSQ